MKELPESVRSRLRQAPAPGEHPDADVLAAFAERGLSVRERETVATHLAGCADCRETLALAADAMEQEPAPERSRGWHAWGWGLAAAAMACCIVVVVRWERPQSRPAADIAQMAKAKAPPPLATQPKIATPAAPEPSAVQAPERRAKKLRAPAPPPPPMAAPTSHQETVSVASAAPVVSEQSLQAVPQPKAKNAPAPMQLRAQAVMAPQSAAMRTGVRNAVAQSAPPQAPLRWSINASPDTAASSQGFVQNSSDGRNWQTVPLNSAVNFRAVASSGPEVWAGGSNGVLLHSLDYGVHWTPVTVAADGAKISGDVVRVEALGRGSVRVETSAGDKWITTDGGAHWTKTE